MKISLRHLSKSYEDAARRLTVLHDINYEFPNQGSVAIVGRSGVGKSTLLHLLGGLDEADSGSVWFDNQNITELKGDKLASFRGSNVGFVFQFHHLLPEFNALENVAMPLIISGQSDSQAFSAAEKILSRVGLRDRAKHRPGELSGGEQQRVAIARALVNRPPVLLTDEPTGSLDFETAKLVQNLMMEIHTELNNVLVVVTHNYELARSMNSVLEMLPGGALVPSSR